LSFSKTRSSNKFNLLHILFPPHCLICGKRTNEENICNDCRKEIKYFKYPLIDHKKNVYFYAVTEYKGVIEKSVKILKFKKRKILAKDLAKIIMDFINKEKIRFEYIGFIPMTRLEQNTRGFNQTYLLAKEISKIYGIPVVKGLRKVKETKKQVGLSKKEREKNLKNAFQMENKIEGNILIIDDVYTTGSTASEITKIVAKNTKSNVYFVALSRKID